MCTLLKYAAIAYWVKCGIAECGMPKVKCGMTVTGPHVRPRDRSYYAVYHNLFVVGTMVDCVMVIWKIALCACYFNLPNMFT